MTMVSRNDRLSGRVVQWALSGASALTSRYVVLAAFGSALLFRYLFRDRFGVTGEITIQGERKFTGIVHDLTSRVQMERRLREREALAKLGEMATVIAHEVKNPLAGIRGAIQVFGSRMNA
jgi:signal transduction histidine kinase